MNGDEALVFLMQLRDTLNQKFGAAPGTGTTPPPPTIPPDTNLPTLPPEIAGRTVMRSTLPWQAWVSSARRTSPGRLDDANVWALGFVTGAAVVGHDVRVEAREMESGPILRHAALVRNRDGAVLTTVKGTSPTIWMTFDTAAQASGIFGAVKPVIAPQSAYTVLIWNDPGHGAGLMSADLYI